MKDSEREVLLAIYGEANKIEDDHIRAEVMAELDLDRDFVMSLGRVAGCAYVIFLAERMQHPDWSLVLNLQVWIISAREFLGGERMDIVIPPSFSVVLLDRAGFRERLLSFARRLEAAIDAEPTFAARSTAGIGVFEPELIDSALADASEGGESPISPSDLDLFKTLTRDLKLDEEPG